MIISLDSTTLDLIAQTEEESKRLWDFYQWCDATFGDCTRIYRLEKDAEALDRMLLYDAANLERVSAVLTELMKPPQGSKTWTWVQGDKDRVRTWTN